MNFISKNKRTCLIWLLFISLLTLCKSSLSAQTNEINLIGEWTVKLDPSSVGEKENWTGQAFSDKINLPGILDEYGYGTKVNPDEIKDPYRTLMRRYRYIGKAWYQKEVDIPEDWKNKKILLHLERIIWKSDVYVDSKKIGTCESLCTPHIFDLTNYLTPGKHKINICIDNSRQYTIGLDEADFSHAYTEQTQIIWNGIIGDMKVEAIDLVYLEDIQVYPCISDKSADVKLEVVNANNFPVDGEILIKNYLDGTTKLISEYKEKFRLDKNKSEIIHIKNSLGADAELWNEFFPKLYTSKIEIKANGQNKEFRDIKNVSFGLREFKADNNKFLINGIPVFLRGTLECAIFPKTGYPPTKVEDWKKIYQTAKSYGLNHFRFHSWCPPEAAFEAADKMGFYLQVELPWWVLDIGKRKDRDDFIKREADRIIKQYGNHPSFCLLSLGNELEGDYDVLHEIVKHLKSMDSRHLYTSTTFSFQGDHGRWPEPVDEFFITQQSKKGWVRGQGIFNSNTPENQNDYRKSIEGISVPVVSHEVGQYSVYPNLKEIEKYTGVLYPNNFEKIKKHLEKNGLLDHATGFTKASGKLAYYLYKEEVERALRTPNLAGIQLLQLYDFPGQGTALVGLLDAFWESKGIIEPKDFSKFCSPVVPLIRMEKFTFKNNEIFNADVEFANYSSSKINDAEVFWKIKDKSKTIAEGIFKNINLDVGTNTVIGKISLALDGVKDAAKLSVVVGLSGTEIVNDWDVWIYPSKIFEPTDMKNEVVITNRIETVVEELTKGEKVFYIPNSKAIIKKETGKFVPVFWSPVHFPEQAATMGLLMNSEHPAFREFPTDNHTNWQWWDLTHDMCAMNVNELPQNLKPIVQVIDDFFNNNKLAFIYEAKVGKGKLLVCSADLYNDLEKRPVAAQLKYSLLKYASSSEFNPNVEISIDVLKSQFKSSVPLMNRRIISTDSQAVNCEGSKALDENTNTMWHTPWVEAVDYPHEIVIDLGEEVNITEVKILPRQDKQTNGFIADYEIYTAQKINEWENPAAKGRFEKTPELKVVPIGNGIGTKCRYVKIKALSGFDNNSFTSIAEIDFSTIETAISN